MQAINDLFTNFMRIVGFLLLLQGLNIAIRSWLAVKQPEHLKRLEEMEQRRRERTRNATLGTVKTGLRIARWFMK